MFRVSEIFPAIQGEGRTLGTPTIFIRFYGCQLRCNFCTEKETEILLSDNTSKKAKDIKISDVLYTPMGNTNVTQLKSRVVEKYVKLKLKDGNELKCTTEHPIILESGKQVKAEDISKGDRVIIIK